MILTQINHTINSFFKASDTQNDTEVFDQLRPFIVNFIVLKPLWIKTNELCLLHFIAKKGDEIAFYLVNYQKNDKEKCFFSIDILKNGNEVALKDDREPEN